jgi:hypothetical protein
MVEDEITTIISKLKELRVRESRLLVDLENAHRRVLSTRRATTPPETTDTTAFEVNDRVYITNKIKPRADRPINEGDRTAIVTVVTQDRVFIRTLNGTTTWRAHHNLRHSQR